MRRGNPASTLSRESSVQHLVPQGTGDRMANDSNTLPLPARRRMEAEPARPARTRAAMGEATHPDAPGPAEPDAA